MWKEAERLLSNDSADQPSSGLENGSCSFSLRSATYPESCASETDPTSSQTKKWVVLRLERWLAGKELAMQPGDLSSDAQHPYKKLGVVV